jgi:hypothetical protein
MTARPVVTAHVQTTARTKKQADRTTIKSQTKNPFHQSRRRCRFAASMTRRSDLDGFSLTVQVELSEAICENPAPNYAEKIARRADRYNEV